MIIIASFFWGKMLELEFGDTPCYHSGVKKVLLLPLVFILLTAVLTLVFSTAYLTILWGQRYNPEQLPSLDIARYLPLAIRTVFPAAIISGIFILLRFVRKGGSNSWPAALFLLGLSFAALFFGELVLSNLPIENLETKNTFISRSIHRFRDASLYIEQSGPQELRTLAIYRAGRTPKLSLHKTAHISTESRTVQYGDEIIPMIPSNPFFHRLFAPDKALQTVGEEIGLMNSLIAGLYKQSWPLFILLIAGITAYCVGTLFTIRLTRWPLFNSLLALLLYRVFFRIFRLPETNLLHKLIQTLNEPILEPLAPTVLLLFLGLLFFTIFLLFGRGRNP